MNEQVLTARWIFPVSGPPLERGTITIADTKIVAVEPHGVRNADVDLGNVAIIPGLVNAHTHLDLSGALGKILPTDPERFCDWLMGVIEYRKTRTAEQVQEDIRNGLAECLNSGTTLIGDITSDGSSHDAIVQCMVRALLFREFIGSDIEIVEQRIQTHFDYLERHNETERCRWRVSPHAPYSIHHDIAYHQMRFAGGAIHLAESPAEMQLLDSKSGPFKQFLQSLGVWRQDSFKLQASEFVTDVVQRTSPAKRLYIHCNYLPVETRFDESQSIVYCPRTHAAFKHPRHPFKEFLDRGVNVALGTDSLASNPDLDLFEEARFLFHNRKDVSPETILQMATLNGAKALGWADECGSLEPGKSADFVVMPLPDRDGEAYELLFESTGPRRTMFQGQWRIP